MIIIFITIQSIIQNNIIQLNRNTLLIVEQKICSHYRVRLQILIHYFKENEQSIIKFIFNGLSKY